MTDDKRVNNKVRTDMKAVRPEDIDPKRRIYPKAIAPEPAQPEFDPKKRIYMDAEPVPSKTLIGHPSPQNTSETMHGHPTPRAAASLEDTLMDEPREQRDPCLLEIPAIDPQEMRTTYIAPSRSSFRFPEFIKNIGLLTVMAGFATFVFYPMHADKKRAQATAPQLEVITTAQKNDFNLVRYLNTSGQPVFRYDGAPLEENETRADLIAAKFNNWHIALGYDCTPTNEFAVKNKHGIPINGFTWRTTPEVGEIYITPKTCEASLEQMRQDKTVDCNQAWLCPKTE